MPEIRIRRATERDMPFFRDMELETTWQSLTARERDEVSLERFRAALAETHALLLGRTGNQIYIAEDVEGERVGMLWFGENRNLVTGDDEAWVFGLVVHPAHRGAGIGTQLLAYADQLARSGGYTTLGLMVAAHNDGARRLYSRHGFQETNVVLRRRLAAQETYP